MKKKNYPNIFEDAAKKRDISVEQVIDNTQKYAKVIMYRIKTSDNQQLKDLWDKAFPDGKVPTAEEFARAWLLFEVYKPSDFELKNKKGEKIDMRMIFEGKI